MPKPPPAPHSFLKTIHKDFTATAMEKWLI